MEEQATQQEVVATMSSACKRGRPVIKIEWPTGVFKSVDIKSEFPLTKAAIQLKIKHAIQNNTIKQVGIIKIPRGRPCKLYRKLEIIQ